jgi:hypothetical protein
MDNSKESPQSLWRYVRRYLTVYLPRIRGLSPKTVEVYTPVRPILGLVDTLA